ncbi:MAG: hypothetical protein GY950_27070, partial [bacterium]|nr:hypothetical protein [bacterium]
EEWIRSDPGNRKTFESLQTIWNTPEARLPKSDIKKLWAEVAKEAGIRKTKPFPFLVLPGYKRLLQYAALAVLVISLPFLLRIIKTSSPVP